MRVLGELGDSSRLDGGIYDMAQLEHVSVLAEEVKERLNAILSSELENEIEAKYKLEIYLNGERSKHKPYPGMVVVFNNGGFAHGGGDETIYLCPARIDSAGVMKSCGAPIDLRFINRDMAICEECKTVIKPKELCGQIFARLTNQYWAALMTRLFKRLDCNADIRITMMRGKLREVTEQETKVKYQHGALINATRRSREHIYYPLANIVRDTMSGADLYGRIRAFLEA
jgi:hypothetical protein